MVNLLVSIPLRNVRNKAVPCLETSYDYVVLYSSSPANKYMPKVNIKNTKTKCETCSDLTVNTSGRRHCLRSGVFIVNFEHIPHLILVSLLLVLNRQMFTRNLCFMVLYIHPSRTTPLTKHDITLLSSLITLNISQLLLVLLMLTLNVYLFSGFDIIIFQSFLD